jgi:plasmid maintenance system antidote protein VapI
MSDKRKQTIDTIRVLGIKKADLAQLADIKPCRISEYFRGKPLSAEKTQRLESTVENIAKVWINLGIKTDLSDTEGFARLLAHVERSLAGEHLDEIAAETQSIAARCNLFSK